VGFNGYPHNALPASIHPRTNESGSVSSQIGFYLHDNTTLDVQSPLLLRGVEWISAWMESAMAFSIRIVYDDFQTPIDITNHEHFLWACDYKLAFFLS
jgi:hypothetical protein